MINDERPEIDDLELLLLNVPLIYSAVALGIKTVGIFGALSRGINIADILKDDIARLAAGRNDPNPIIFGIVYSKNSENYDKINDVWKRIKNKYSGIVVFQEIDKENQENEVKLFNDNIFNKKVFGDNNLDETRIISYPTFFYTDNQKINYFNVEDFEIDLVEKSLNKLIKKLIFVWNRQDDEYSTNNYDSTPYSPITGGFIKHNRTLRKTKKTNNKQYGNTHNKYKYANEKYGVKIFYK